MNIRAWTRRDMTVAETQKLAGSNYIDDGLMLVEEEMGDEPIKASLATIDGLLTQIRKGLNDAVKEGLSVAENAGRWGVSEDPGVAKLKAALSKLFTGYTETVSALQAARQSIGYDVEGPSVTQGNDGEQVEHTMRRVAGRAGARDRAERLFNEAQRAGAQNAVFNHFKKSTMAFVREGRHTVTPPEGTDVVLEGCTDRELLVLLKRHALPSKSLDEIKAVIVAKTR